MNTIIEAKKLSCGYRKLLAVDQLDLSVQEGTIHALLGANGAGKSTTIKTLLNLIRPRSGTASILGTPSAQLGQEDFQRIGYVSEDHQLPWHMTVKELMDFCRPLYPKWDQDFCNELLQQFDLPLGRKLKALSRGMKMKAALVSSISYRPQVLILDEPFSGLDPVVREDFIEGILSLTENDKWTILVSSHDMEEVERLADTIDIINQGRLVVSDSLENLQRRFRKIEVITKGGTKLPSGTPKTWHQTKGSDSRIELIHSNYQSEETEAELHQHLDSIVSIEAEPISLKNIYLSIAREASQNKRTLTSSQK